MEEWLCNHIRDTLQLLGEVVRLSGDTSGLYNKIHNLRRYFWRVAHGSTVDTLALRSGICAETFMQYNALIRYNADEDIQLVVSTWKQIYRQLRTLDRHRREQYESMAAKWGIVFDDIWRDTNDHLGGYLEMRLVSHAL